MHHSWSMLNGKFDNNLFPQTICARIEEYASALLVWAMEGTTRSAGEGRVHCGKWLPTPNGGPQAGFQDMHVQNGKDQEQVQRSVSSANSSHLVSSTLLFSLTFISTSESTLDFISITQFTLNFINMAQFTLIIIHQHNSSLLISSTWHNSLPLSLAKPLYS